MSEKLPDWAWVEKRFEYNEYLWSLEKPALIQIINSYADRLNKRELELSEEEEKELLGEEE